MATKKITFDVVSNTARIYNAVIEIMVEHAVNLSLMDAAVALRKACEDDISRSVKLEKQGKASNGTLPKHT